MIITHDGKFHADEVMACAILRMAGYTDPIVRTRDWDVIEKGLDNPGTILLDVGRQYSPTLRNFDHHQPDFDLWRDPELRHWPYATAGLVWAEYGMQVVSSFLFTTYEMDDLPYGRMESLTEVLQSVHAEVDKSAIRALDAVDNGVSLRTEGLTLSRIISLMNTNTDGNNDAAFLQAVDVAQSALYNLLRSAIFVARSAHYVRCQARKAQNGIMVMNVGAPWIQVISEEFPEIIGVLIPAQGKRWNIQIARDAGRTDRATFPEHWKGLTDDLFQEVSGVKDAIFCHRDGFLASANSYEGASKLAEALVACPH